MTPTAELRTRLRKLLDEVIPTGGTESDTRFLDADLDELLAEARNVFGATSAGWTMKAGMIARELGNLQSHSVGQEQYVIVNLQTAQRTALEMADRYDGMARAAGGSGSMVVPIERPEVI